MLKHYCLFPLFCSVLKTRFSWQASVPHTNCHSSPICMCCTHTNSNRNLCIKEPNAHCTLHSSWNGCKGTSICPPFVNISGPETRKILLQTWQPPFLCEENFYVNMGKILRQWFAFSGFSFFFCPELTAWDIENSSASGSHTRTNETNRILFFL